MGHSLRLRASTAAGALIILAASSFAGGAAADYHPIKPTMSG